MYLNIVIYEYEYIINKACTFCEDSSKVMNIQRNMQQNTKQKSCKDLYFDMIWDMIICIGL